MGMYMRHALASVYTILYGDVQGRRMKDTLHHTRDALHGQEQILHFRGGQIVETRHDPAGRDKDMARQQWLEIDDGKGQAGEVEDLDMSTHVLHVAAAIGLPVANVKQHTWLETTKVPNLMASFVSGMASCFSCP